MKEERGEYIDYRWVQNFLDKQQQSDKLAWGGDSADSFDTVPNTPRPRPRAGPTGPVLSPGQALSQIMCAFTQIA